MKKMIAMLVFLGLLVGVGANMSLNINPGSRVSINAAVDPEDFTDIDELIPRP
jgi:hypothetical protein